MQPSDFVIQHGVLAKYTGRDASVTVPEGVTEIGKSAFRGRPVKRVHLPETLTAIGEWAFSECKRIERIDIPDGVVKLGFGAFDGCERLKSLRLPSRLTELEGEVFLDCKALRTVDLPDGVTKLGFGAFDGCESLKSLRLPPRLTELKRGVFRGCKALRTVDLPDGLLAVGEGAFSGCTSLASVALPASVMQIGEDVCKGCTSLKTAAYPADFSCIRCGGKLDETGLCQKCGLRRTEPPAGNGAAVAVDSDPSHWVYDRVEESPEGNAPCVLVYDYTGPLDSVMLPETLEGLPVTGVSLYFSAQCDIWDPAFEEPRMAMLRFPSTVHWLRGGDIWARIEPAGSHAIMMKRENPEQCKWRLYGARCTKICTALEYAVCGPFGGAGLIFMNRDGVWLSGGFHGYPIDGPDDVYCEDPDACRSCFTSPERILRDVEELPEHGKLSLYHAYCYDYGMGTSVSELSFVRDGELVTIDSDFSIPKHTVGFEALCRGLAAEGLEELMWALHDMGCEASDALLEPRD